jgi:uroporphyrinogen-III decarboxylase
MTPRERILKILNHEQPDKVPWFGDLDYWATSLVKRGIKPEGFISSSGYIDWHRDLGVGFYLQGYFPFKTIYQNCDVRDWNEGNRRFREIGTPVGKVRECWEYIPASFTEGPVEHFLKSEDDLPAMKFIYENIRFEPDYDFAHERLKQVGEQGIVLCYLPKSPFMHLVALEAGIESVTLLAMLNPDGFSELLLIMKKAFDQAARIAVDSPAEVLMIPENLSSEMVGPQFFESYMREYQEEWVREIKKAGKFSFIHIDGTLRGLLREEASTGFSVLEALTPKPSGDMDFREIAALANNPDSILWGGIPGVCFTNHISDEEFDRHVCQVIEVMRAESRYVLGVADQVPPDGLESRVRRVGELVDRYGSYE